MLEKRRKSKATDIPSAVLGSMAKLRKASLKPYVSAVLKACLLQVAPPGVKLVESTVFSGGEILQLNAAGPVQARVEEAVPLLTMGLDWMSKQRMDDVGLKAKLKDDFEERMAHYFHCKKIKGRPYFKTVDEVLADLVHRVADATGTPVDKMKHPFGDKLQLAEPGTSERTGSAPGATGSAHAAGPKCAALARTFDEKGQVSVDTLKKMGYKLGGVVVPYKGHGKDGKCKIVEGVFFEIVGMKASGVSLKPCRLERGVETDQEEFKLTCNRLCDEYCLAPQAAEPPLRVDASRDALSQDVLAAGVFKSHVITALACGFKKLEQSFGLVTVQVRPHLAVYAKCRLEVGAVTFVPLSTTVVLQGTSEGVSPKDFLMGEARALGTSVKTVVIRSCFEHPEMKGASSAGVVPTICLPFWATRTSVDASEANVEIQKEMVHVNQGIKIMIGVLRNFMVVEPGKELLIHAKSRLEGMKERNSDRAGPGVERATTGGLEARVPRAKPDAHPDLLRPPAPIAQARRKWRRKRQSGPRMGGQHRKGSPPQPHSASTPP